VTNPLFQQAREAVAYANSVFSGSEQGDQQVAVMKAKNALSSAFANCTDAERAQLRELQQTLTSM
jgi:Protein of unknown function (DUF3813)